METINAADKIKAFQQMLKERIGKQPDVVVFSDGSGYTDGYGGWATYCITPDGMWKTFRTGFVIGTTVDRAEMTGMLEGLQMADEMLRQMPEALTDMHFKGHVVVFTDRENMVLSSKGIYDRSNCKDLWCRYAYYEGRFKIEMIHVAREADFEQFQVCDITASTGRLIAKAYAESASLPPWQLYFG